MISKSGRPPAGGGQNGGAALTAPPAEEAAEGRFAKQGKTMPGAAQLSWRVFL